MPRETKITLQEKQKVSHKTRVILQNKQETAWQKPELQDLKIKRTMTGWCEKHKKLRTEERLQGGEKQASFSSSFPC